MATCLFPTCKRLAEKNGYCFLHRVFAPGEPRKKERVQIVKYVKKVAESRKEDNKEYKRIVKEKMKESRECELKVPGICTKISTGCHHQKKRAGKLLTDKRFLKRSCNECNYWCELHPLEAIKLGLSFSKFT